MNIGFRTANLSDIAHLNPGIGRPLPSDTTVSFIPMSAVSADTASTNGVEGRLYSEVSKGYTPFLNGDVLLAKITPCFENGKIAQAILKHEAGFGSTEFHVVRPKSGMADARYLLHYLRQESIRRDGERKMTGSAGQRRVPEYFLANLLVPLPPLAEQRRIADVLDRAEDVRAKRRAALVHLDNLTQAIFIEMFGDPRINEQGWPISSIGAVVFDMRGGAALEPDDFVDSGFPILHKGAIKPSGEIGIDSKKKTFSSLDFAAAKLRCQANREFIAITLRDLVPTGPSIGLAVNLREGPFEEYLLAQGAYAFRLDPKKVVPEYFVYLSNVPSFRHVLRQNAVGSTQIHIRTPIYLAIPIQLPPVKLQHEFARRVAVIEKLKSVCRASLTELDMLFTALQYRAFRGEL